MNQKTILSIIAGLLTMITTTSAQPKYIFYLIGDGMGLNHVNLVEIFKSESNNKIGYQHSVLSNFPNTTFISTNSLSHGVTDSGAGGTALSVGKKTKNGVIAMDSSATISYKSIADASKEKGLKVGIVTSVSIDHATPAAFYAHQPNRNNYHDIAKEIANSNFDFFAGSGFLQQYKTNENSKEENITNILTRAGYQIIEGKQKSPVKLLNEKKTIWINDSNQNNESLKYAIDQTPNDLNLADFTSGAIQNLSNNNENGFFLMIEGGKIDWASHSNDAATTIKETDDFLNSVKIAYNFYLEHPEETLIVVTADHETGGLIIGNGESELNTKILAHQKISQEKLSILLNQLRKDNPNANWQEVKSLISKYTGLWNQIQIDSNDESIIYEAYKKSFINHKNETSKTLYANDVKIAAISIELLNKLANISWASNNHSASYVPVYAIGKGSEIFKNKLDNTDVPKLISKISGLKLD